MNKFLVDEKKPVLDWWILGFLFSEIGFFIGFFERPNFWPNRGFLGFPKNSNYRKNKAQIPLLSPFLTTALFKSTI